MKKVLVFCVLIMVLLVFTACSQQTQESNLSNKQSEESVIAADPMEDVFYSMEEFEDAVANTDGTNRNLKKQSHFYKLENTKDLELKKIDVYDFGIMIYYKLLKPDQSMIDKLQQTTVSGSEFLQYVTVVTHLNFIVDGKKPPVVDDSYSEVEKNGMTLYIREVTTIEGIKIGWNIYYLNDMNYVSVDVPVSIGYENALNLCKTTKHVLKKSLQKPDKDNGAEPLTTTLSNETTEVSQPTEPNTDKSTEPIGTQQAITTP
jgi:hypothetical protein